jgi:hypothetical protein
MEVAMRKALFLAVMGTLLLAAMVEVVAAGMKGFPTELLPQ